MLSLARAAPGAFLLLACQPTCRQGPTWLACRCPTTLKTAVPPFQLPAALPRPLCTATEQFIIKPPHSNLASAFNWHCDSQYASSTGRTVQYSPYVSLWVALDDMAPDNGCLVVLPGGRMTQHGEWQGHWACLPICPGI